MHINKYDVLLSSEEIENQAHRNFVGGMWDVIGKLQFDFILEQGLKPHHKLLDLGCGCMRGGLHFIKYLDNGNYYGLDINSSLIDAAKIEIANAGLANKEANLLVDNQFRSNRFSLSFDYVLSVSLFTHLPMNMIIRCLAETRKTMNGSYWSTFFRAPHSAYLNPYKHGEITTNYDKDPYHYSFDEIEIMAKLSGLKVDWIGEWNHPRKQQMARFFI